MDENNQHNCKDYLEYDHIVDECSPFGDIKSIAVFKCSKCGKKYTEEELT